jgi:hypothetical protein
MKRVWTIGILAKIQNRYLPNRNQKPLLLELPCSLKAIRKKLTIYLVAYMTIDFSDNFSGRQPRHVIQFNHFNRIFEKPALPSLSRF